MSNLRITRLSVQLFFLDIILTLAGLWIASFLRSAIPYGPGGPLSVEQTALPWPIYLAATAIWSTALTVNRCYDPRMVLRWFNEAARVVGGSILATVLLAGFLYFTFRDVSRLQFVYFFLINIFLLLSYRALFRLQYRISGRSRPGKRERVLILGAGELGLRAAKVVLDHSRWGFDLVGFLDDDPAKQGGVYLDVPVLGPSESLQEIVLDLRVHEVWITLPARAHTRVKWIVNELERLPVRINIVPDYYSLALITAKPDILGGLPVIGLRDPVIEGFPRIVKRAFDLVVTASSMLIAGPIMAVIAFLIRLNSEGSVFFRQRRYGENGRIFEMYKFRTMRVGAEDEIYQIAKRTDDGMLIHKRPDDPRVTKVGKFLRRYSLDELPQLFNVLKGDMSLVGPRPEIPWLVDRYDSWQRKRFAVPQGITGWWQISGRSDKPMHLNTEDDLFYVYNYSLWLDIQILLRTPVVVLRGKGAF